MHHYVGKNLVTTLSSYNATNPPIGLSPEQMGQLRPEDRPQDESKEQVGLTAAEMLQLELDKRQNCQLTISLI